MEFIAEEEGYLMTYTSNQTNEDLNVFSDDFTVMHTTGQIVRVDDYYPFGLTFNSSEREGSLTNRHLYQSKEWQDDLGLNLYDFEWRQYDPLTVRTPTLDPHTENFYEESPYSWVGNNPILNIDPTGMDWFVSNNNGVLINIQGASEFNYKQLEEDYGTEVASLIYKLGGSSGADSWENFGADDMFDIEDNKISENLGQLTMFTEEASEQFMSSQGFQKALDQRVEELDFTMYEQDAAGMRKDDGGNKKILSSKVTYKRSNEFGVFNKEVAPYENAFLKMKTTAYRQIIRYDQRRSKGSDIWSKGVPDFKKTGLDFYKDIVVPWMLKKRKK